MEKTKMSHLRISPLLDIDGKLCFFKLKKLLDLSIISVLKSQ